MRTELSKINNIRTTYTGTFSRLGKKNNKYSTKTLETILLLDIKNSSGKVLTEHLWFNYTKGFRKLGLLQEGDLISFRARVKPYIKGYHKDQLDFKLSHPTDIKLVGRERQSKNQTTLPV